MTAVEAPVKAGRSNVVSDLIAGITTALVTIPDAMAPAKLADGLRPGLHCARRSSPVRSHDRFIVEVRS